MKSSSQSCPLENSCVSCKNGQLLARRSLRKHFLSIDTAMNFRAHQNLGHMVSYTSCSWRPNKHLQWLQHKSSLDSEGGEIYSASLVRGMARWYDKEQDIGEGKKLGSLIQSVSLPLQLKEMPAEEWGEWGKERATNKKGTTEVASFVRDQA